VVDELADDEVELQVGSIDGRIAAHEAAGLGEVRRQHAVLRRRHSKTPFRRLIAPRSDRPNRIGEVRRVEDGDDVDVVVQVAADAGQVVANSMPSERRCSPGPIPDSISSCGDCSAPAASSTSRARGTNVGTPSSAHLDAGRAPPSSGFASPSAPVMTCRLVRARCGRQVRLGGAEALAVLVRHLVEADAFLARAVEVGVDARARLPRRLDEDRPEAMRAAQVHDVERAALPWKRRRRARCARRAEVRQHVVPAQPGCLRSPSRRSPRAGRARRSSR
jgi:hypothetical protein